MAAGFSRRTAAIMEEEVFHSKALRPEMISYRIAPKERMSLRASASMLSICSVDMY